MQVGQTGLVHLFDTAPDQMCNHGLVAGAPHNPPTLTLWEPKVRLALQCRLLRRPAAHSASQVAEVPGYNPDAPALPSPGRKRKLESGAQAGATGEAAGGQRVEAAPDESSVILVTLSLHRD